MRVALVARLVISGILLSTSVILGILIWISVAFVLRPAVATRPVSLGNVVAIFWYHLNGMGTQKNASQKVLATLFPYIFHVKTKWNIIYEYLKTKIFSRDTNIFPQVHLTSNIFGLQPQPLGVLGYH